jgi:hypothetical protein
LLTMSNSARLSSFSVHKAIRAQNYYMCCPVVKPGTGDYQISIHTTFFIPGHPPKVELSGSDDKVSDSESEVSDSEMSAPNPHQVEPAQSGI